MGDAARLRSAEGSGRSGQPHADPAIDRSKRCVRSAIAEPQFAAQTLAVGTNAGLEVDKFSAFELGTFAAEKIDVPMLAGCITWMECKVIPDDSQRHDLIIGEVVAAYADSRVYSNNRWHFGDDPDLRTCHYVAGGTFFATGEAFEVSPAANALSASPASR